MNKHEIAQIFDEIGTLLAIQGENQFKVRAYHNAARAIENLEQPLKAVIEEGCLEDISGIGKSLAEKITTLVETGRLAYYEKLKKSIPKGVLELLKVPGLGAKKVKILYEKLKIKTIDDLNEACHKGKVAKLPGFGLKTANNLLTNIAKLKIYGKRTLWWNANAIAEPLFKKLSQLKLVKKVAIAGSLRRKLETVGDLDFLIASSKPDAIVEWFATQTWVEQVLSQGSTKASIRLKEGLQVDLRIISEKAWGFALLYFTGSKEHNIKLRIRANRLGYRLSEYGFEPLNRKKKPLLSSKKADERAIYKALGLSYIPPELREDLGEIEAAEKGKLPRLVEAKDIRGVFHCHTTGSDGHNTLEEMALAAENYCWEYLGIADHSKSSFQAGGMKEDRLFKQIEQIQKLNQLKKFSTYLFAGLECDIMPDGRLDFPNTVLKQLDYVIVSVHRSFNLNEKAMTKRLIKAIENPYTTMVGHVTGRLLLKRDAYALNLSKVIDACIANGKIIELNAHPMRLDMDWRFWHKAKERGLKCSINPDAHATSDLEYFLAGIHVARKGWLEKNDILNTYPLTKVKAFLKKIPLY